jgi:hypothetical protein
MKILIVPIVILLISACTSPQKEKDTSKEKTAQVEKKITLAGTYSYGAGADKGASGDIAIFPKDDTTLLFNIDLSVGPPSYNMGELYDTLKVKDNRAIYFKKSDGSDKGCKWQIDFYGDSLTIKTLDNGYDCGFGNGVSADGKYTVINHDVPSFYISMEGDTLYFGK